MTVDERLQFLLQSTESLHSSMQEMHTSMQELSASVTDLKRVVEIDADNIRRLANIAATHNDGIEDLRTRLERIERRSKEKD